MRQKIRRAFIIGRRFKREFRRQIRMLITFSLGLTIAFTWRQTVFDLSKTFVSFITNIKDTTTLTILTSIFVTLFAVLVIILATYFLQDDLNNH